MSISKVKGSMSTRSEFYSFLISMGAKKSFVTSIKKLFIISKGRKKPLMTNLAKTQVTLFDGF